MQVVHLLVFAKQHICSDIHCLVQSIAIEAFNAFFEFFPQFINVDRSFLLFV